MNIADCYLNSFECFQTPSNITKFSRNTKLYKNAIEHAFKRCQTLLNTFEHCWLLPKRYQILSNVFKLYQTFKLSRNAKLCKNAIEHAAKHYWTLLNIADCYLIAFERCQTSSNITKLSRNAKLCKNAIEHAAKLLAHY